MKFIRIIYESGTNNRPPGTKLWRSGTKGRRQPGTTHDCVKLSLRSLGFDILLRAGNMNQLES